MTASTPSYQQDIKPLFQERDRQSMDFLFDLWDYQDVRDNAQDILRQLESGRMPCYGAWPEEQVAFFRRWVESGMAE